MKECICEVCQKKYQYRNSKNRPNSRFCSNECKKTKVHTWVKGNPYCFKWETASEEEKWKRVKQGFEKKVIKNHDNCWGWKGNTHSSLGYGRVQYNNKHKMKAAHNISWMIHRGIIPDGMRVLHKCDNPICTNPDHLFLGTQYENVRDMVYKNRQAKGSKCGLAKLNEEKVKEIKNLLEKGVSAAILSAEYGVSKTVIFNIKNNKSWRHVSC